MTIASAFNDIAVAQGGTAKSGTISGAIDALNDALAGSDQQAASTIEGAVRLLGEHIGGGGSFGPLQNIVLVVSTMPEVGDEMTGENHMYSIGSGGTVYAQGNLYNPISVNVAAGLTAVVYSNAEDTVCDAYVCSVDDDFLYTSVTPWNGTVTIGSMEQEGETYATYTLTIPEMNTGERLVLYAHSA